MSPGWLASPDSLPRAPGAPSGQRGNVAGASAAGAAEVASADYRTSHSVNSAYDAALGSVTNSSETIPANQFTVDADGTVHLVLLRTTTTLLVHRVGPLKKYAIVTVHGEATPPTL